MEEPSLLKTKQPNFGYFPKRGGGSSAAKLFIEIKYEQNIYGQNMPSMYRPSSEGYVHLTRARVEFRFHLLEVYQPLLRDDLIDF